MTLDEDGPGGRPPSPEPEPGSVIARLAHGVVRYAWIWILLILLAGIAYFAFSGDFSVLPAIYRVPAGG